MAAAEIRALAVNAPAAPIFFAVTKRQESRARAAYLPCVKLDERLLSRSGRAMARLVVSCRPSHHIWWGTKRDCGSWPDSAPVRSGFDPRLNAAAEAGPACAISGWRAKIAARTSGSVPKRGGQPKKGKKRRKYFRAGGPLPVNAAVFSCRQQFTRREENAARE